MGLDLNVSNPTASTQRPRPMNPPSYHSDLRPSPPISGRSTPASQTLGNRPKPLPATISKANGTTISNDSFAKLVSFNAPHSTKNLSLQEQQKALQERSRAQAQEQTRSLGLNSDDQSEKFWNSLGEGRATPDRVTAPPTYAGTDEYGGPKLSKAINKPFAGIASISGNASDEIDRNGKVDLLLDFGSSPLADKPKNKSEGQAFSESIPSECFESSEKVLSNPSLVYPNRLGNDNKDENAFFRRSSGPLDKIKNMGTIHSGSAANSAGEDDILGLLARPVSDFPQSHRDQSPARAAPVDPSHSIDHAIAEMVEMGFSLDLSKAALGSTKSGSDIQAAVSYLLSQPHDEPESKTQPQRYGRDYGSDAEDSEPQSDREYGQSPSGDVPLPVWMQENKQSTDVQRRQNSKSPLDREMAAGKHSAERGNSFLKTANSLWKTGAKKLNQAVAEINSDSDSSQPKWMRESQNGPNTRRPRSRETKTKLEDHMDESYDRQLPSKGNVSSVTDEALMLESRVSRLPPQKAPRQSKAEYPAWSSDSSRDQSPAFSNTRGQDLSQPRFLQRLQANDAKEKLNRQAIEEQSANAYISPARRKKPLPTLPSPEPDLLFDASHATPKRRSPILQKSNVLLNQSIPPKSLQERPKIHPRSIPSLAPSALQLSNANRREGTSAFKRGDYALATTSYTTALSALPATHPLVIVLLTNRALAHLKTGDPKSSIADTTSALSLIGPSQGTHESIDLGDEGHKDMKPFWLKAMTRQAEAFEQLERWPEAAAAWRSCIEAGLGDAVSIAGRNRCEKAITGTILTSQPPKPAFIRKSPLKPVTKISASKALSDHPSRTPQPSQTSSIEAVTRLRKANQVAERLDDEKFALSDQVSERVARWRAGKEKNLRALLASLETVLWEGAGWKKVSMGELIIANKVKIVYMKGIGRVHPDKVRFTASHTVLYKI